MNLSEAVNAPRIHQQWLPDETYYEDWGLSATRWRCWARASTRWCCAPPQPHRRHSGGAPSLGGQPIEGNSLYGAIDPRLPMGLAKGY
jgi:gamma-glutamyltranspeptidase/glutathione hydrolase